ncbi:hypothetical protein C8R43DRAFT_969144 [Mycena crocata]|nr:hypothetical protein C8R43DRAFT_969144 [Mycena crocata]
MSSPRRHVPTANTCQTCDRHLSGLHPSKTLACERCLPDTITELKTCECHLARYCSTDCQKADWKAHKSRCRIAHRNIAVARLAGCEERHVSFVRWCSHSRDQFVFPALWALEAGTDDDKTETHVFVIYVDTDEEPSASGRVNLKRRIRTAKCLSDDDLREEFADRYTTWRTPPSQALCARVWFVDLGLPYGLDCGDQMLEMVEIVKIRSELFPGMNCDWLSLLEDSVAAGSPLPYGPYIYRFGSTRALEDSQFTANEAWKAEYGEYLVMAAFSALNIPRHPKRIVTQCLLVHIDVHQAAYTIRSASMVSLPELRPLFHCDLYGGSSASMKELLFSQPNILRVLIVDDSLAPGKHIQVVAMELAKYGDPRRIYNYDPDWFTTLKRKVET